MATQSLSRIGKQTIALPPGVTVTKADGSITVKGAKGELTLPLVDTVSVSVTDEGLSLSPKDTSASTKALHGLIRSQLQNMVQGVSEGFKKELELQGVGFRVSLSGKALKLNLGFSHEITYTLPENIEVQIEGPRITVSGHDKQLVGQTAANIRALKKPEPYKGKGIRYVDEYVVRKSGKTAA